MCESPNSIRGSDLATRMAKYDGRRDVEGFEEVDEGDLQCCAEGLGKFWTINPLGIKKLIYSLTS